ncbi:MAG: hypothetical protein GWM90_17785, partial [Gemmatimonadetes bacterium]|nr:hypothetical protein [Gemmatimonadota bacterium]NIQ56202.1 hypothetical protein [Gemmatimonadota bacterium]NIU76396.1 hypothetical protein [Gammaproteobacteria bacterium]NIX45875.1 hypothetical protein [Gemmatimonadota bacterium]
MSPASPGAAIRAPVLAGLALVTATAVAGAYRTGPPPGHTGAFDQPDCAACHFDALRDDPAGSVALEAPERYRPGGTYEVTVTLRYPELPAGGFQLAARYLEGPCAGRQAGALEATDERTRIQTGEDGVAYASHSEDGVTPR